VKHLTWSTISMLLVIVFCRPGAAQDSQHTRLQELMTRDQIIDILTYTGPEDTLPGTRGSKMRPPSDRAVQVTFHILFKTGSTELADDFSVRQMQEAGEALSSDALSVYRFEIAGHTDSVGTEAANLALSLQRAHAVRRFLIGFYGISDERLLARGYGECQPIASNDTVGGRAQNRRVVILRRGIAQPIETLDSYPPP
jgi:outer membrane protein OmpA-like peptidoglycan-associated protein